MSKAVPRKLNISARISEYAVPPIKDMLILGKHAPVGCIAVCRALELLVKMPFEHIEIDNDDVICDILVRQPLLRRVSREELIHFVLIHIKPLMGPGEVFHAELNIDLFLAGGA